MRVASTLLSQKVPINIINGRPLPGLDDMFTERKVKSKVPDAGSSVVCDGPVTNSEIADSSIKEWSDRTCSSDRPGMGGERICTDIGTGSRR